MSHDGAKNQPKDSADRTDHERFADYKGKDLTGGDAQAAQRTEQRATLHHGKGHRVVNQEQPHEQGQQAQGHQVGTESGRHLLDGTSAGLDGQDAGVLRQQPADTIGQSVVFLRQDQVNAIQFADAVGQFLGRGDVSQDDAIEGAATEIVGWLEQPGDESAALVP